MGKFDEQPALPFDRPVSHGAVNGTGQGGITGRVNREVVEHAVDYKGGSGLIAKHIENNDAAFHGRPPQTG